MIDGLSIVLGIFLLLAIGLSAYRGHRRLVVILSPGLIVPAVALVPTIRTRFLEPHDRGVEVVLLFLIVSTALLTAIVGVGRPTGDSLQPRRWGPRAILSLFSLLYLFVALETVFRFVVVQSDSFAFTKSSRLWFDAHWGPLNSHGYRDAEWNDPGDRSVVFVVGDSFVAGQGIEDRQDRFGDLLQADLGSDVRVFNLARLGWSTAEEHDAIVEHPARPDAIVLSYYINDIERAARFLGKKRPVLVAAPSPSMQGLIRHSYLADHLYWRLYRFGNRRLTEEYWDHLLSCHEDERIWSVHRRELDDLVADCQSQGIGIVAVVFPYLFDVAGSRAITDRIAAHLRSRGVEVLDLARELEGEDPANLVVNALDAHPGEALHRRVAGWLLPTVQNLIHR